MLGRGALLALLAATLAGPAAAQTSLFGQPTTQPAPLAAPPAAAAAPQAAAKPKPKPRGPVPARALAISNVSGSALTELVVAADGKQAKLARELGDGQSATLKLPAFKSCTVTISATFERAGEAEQMEQDICRDRKLRLTNAGAT